MKKHKILFILLMLLIIVAVIIIALVYAGIIDFEGISPRIVGMKNSKTSGKIDDWQYEYDNNDYGMKYNTSISPNSFDSFAAYDSAGVSPSAITSESSNLGFSTGGAKDINNFRENIEHGYFPLESDITYEGIFYDYYFDTGKAEAKDKMFYPSATTAVSKDPISGEENYYVSVGLNSNIKQEDFSRKKLNLVVVLDISGSMSSSISNYYYDFNEESKSNKTKMKLAEEAVNVLIDQLNPEDSFGMVLFDDGSYLAKPLNKVADIDMEAIKNHVLEVQAMGGTNFEAGYTKAQDVFEECGKFDTNEYENRIIVITDAMPNIGTTDKDGLLKYMKDSSEDKIYTTFIGVGLDFNTEVIKAITNVKGANYYSVSSEEQFIKRMGEEFEYMVTPLVFDLNMELDSEDFAIEKIYGTDDIDSENSNTIMHVNTLFPSASNASGEVKGGIILLKLKKLNEDAKEFNLKVNYETRDGKKDENIEKVSFTSNEEYYDNTGIRKGIVLSRYVNLIKDWTSFERSKDDRYLITPIIGIIDWYDAENSYQAIDDYLYSYPYYSYYSENERTSVKLTVSEEYKQIFEQFKEYMSKEIEEIKDDTMEQEIDILDKICS